MGSDKVIKKPPFKCEWTGKPTEPGHYWTRTGENKPEYMVIVRRCGRGLSVFCPKFNDRVGMAEIGDDELEWRKA
jgi:hypothetical protein